MYRKESFRGLQGRLLACGINFLHRHIKDDADVHEKMAGNAVFRLFCERSVDMTLHSSPGDTASFIVDIVHRGLFGVAPFIISIILLSRFKQKTHISLHCATWRPLFLSSLLIADKMWEDKPVRNSSIPMLFPALTNQEINALENTILMEIGFNLLITPTLFNSFCEKLLAEAIHPEIELALHQSQLMADLTSTTQYTDLAPSQLLTIPAPDAPTPSKQPNNAKQSHTPKQKQARARSADGRALSVPRRTAPRVQAHGAGKGQVDGVRRFDPASAKQLCKTAPMHAAGAAFAAPSRKTVGGTQRRTVANVTRPDGHTKGGALFVPSTSIPHLPVVVASGGRRPLAHGKDLPNGPLIQQLKKGEEEREKKALVQDGEASPKHNGGTGGDGVNAVYQQGNVEEGTKADGIAVSGPAVGAGDRHSRDPSRVPSAARASKLKRDASNPSRPRHKYSTPFPNQTKRAPRGTATSPGSNAMIQPKQPKAKAKQAKAKQPTTRVEPKVKRVPRAETQRFAPAVGNPKVVSHGRLHVQHPRDECVSDGPTTERPGVSDAAGAVQADQSQKPVFESHPIDGRSPSAPPHPSAPRMPAFSSGLHFAVPPPSRGTVAVPYPGVVGGCHPVPQMSRLVYPPAVDRRTLHPIPRHTLGAKLLPSQTNQFHVVRPPLVPLGPLHPPHPLLVAKAPPPPPVYYPAPPPPPHSRSHHSLLGQPQRPPIASNVAYLRPSQNVRGEHAAVKTQLATHVRSGPSFGSAIGLPLPHGVPAPAPAAAAALGRSISPPHHMWGGPRTVTPQQEAYMAAEARRLAAIEEERQRTEKQLRDRHAEELFRQMDFHQVQRARDMQMRGLEKRQSELAERELSRALQTERIKQEEIKRVLKANREQRQADQ
ncbi:unnamed protein product [Vitrella brassicaformis CCMP3155]|uniref:Cyclin N-terminal domain-containing protein n=1 Tax=Vitrella brassicaformis (strain CCMP3155) TaxID=1169540 RepID=A0A0G4EP35_VITBC|nr:unnamed protein product [Vitrella brassicaformis CCMP3155]|eukprot:CEL98568.1 unnamed protein product [Vitrella brassicaformis CCMP3155]